MWRLIALGILGLALAGCRSSALNQFPEPTVAFKTDLRKLDQEYEELLQKIYCQENDEAKRKIRNKAIERAKRVIDIRFERFRQALAKQEVKADFGTNLISIGAGAAGALVGESASRILSAVNASVSGGKEAFDSVAFYEQTMPALLAQMIATRNELLVLIRSGMMQSYEDYPLVLAMEHLQAYEFAGSVPGAVIAISADANDKNDKAAVILTSNFLRDKSGDIIRKFWKPDGTKINDTNDKTIKEFFEKHGIAGESIIFFIRSEHYQTLRARMVSEFKLDKGAKQ